MKRPIPGRPAPDFSATTVSINMADYQKLKKAEFAMKKEMERMAEMHWARTLQLTEKLATAEQGHEMLRGQLLSYQHQSSVDRKSHLDSERMYQLAQNKILALKDKILVLKNKIAGHMLVKPESRDERVNRERKVVLKYLHEFADSVATLKPDENLAIFGVRPGDQECDL